MIHKRGKHIKMKEIAGIVQEKNEDMKSKTDHENKQKRYKWEDLGRFYVILGDTKEKDEKAKMTLRLLTWKRVIISAFD